MERTKQIAASFFEELGYSVAEIPVADGKRADLDVFDGKNRYIVEVKEKLETDSKVEHTTVGESDSIVHVRQEPHSRSNRLDGVFKRGAAQLAETPCASDAFMLILLHSEGPFADITVRRALITYYGSVRSAIRIFNLFV